MWRTSQLRDLQRSALHHALDPSMCGSKLLLATRTGSGKTLVMKVAGVMMGEVAVIIIPLLSLSADQMEKMVSAKQQFGET